MQIELGLYCSLLRIRKTEEAIADQYSKQQMRCPIHLSIGQEAVPVGICAHLSDEDRVYSNHRCHAHYLAKGGSVNEMIAELYGKVTGCAKGKGGSMHLVDFKKGMMGASALVGGTIAMAVGSALSFKKEKKPLVSVTFFGDGGSEEGIFYESLNFASLHKLPVIFACENNLYATYSHTRARQATEAIYKRGEALGVVGERVDGNNVVLVYEASKKAIDRARRGEGPTLFEFTTYRWRDHVGPSYDYSVGYRTQKEVEEWMATCPIKRLEKELLTLGVSERDLQKISDEVSKEVSLGFEFAEKSPYPQAEELFRGIYA